MRNNVLLVLAGLFALSLIGRSFALSANDAMRAAANRGTQEEAASPETAESAGSDDSPADFFRGEVCASGPVLAEIKEREAALIEKEAAYAEKKKTLQAVETRVEERMALLDQMNDKLSTAMTAIEAETDQDISHLASMYENMKPQEASRIFNRMDPTFAAGFLRIMNSTNAGLILAGMEPEKAYSISVVLASRNADYREALSN